MCFEKLYDAGRSPSRILEGARFARGRRCGPPPDLRGARTRDASPCATVAVPRREARRTGPAEPPEGGGWDCGNALHPDGRRGLCSCRSGHAAGSPAQDRVRLPARCEGRFFGGGNVPDAGHGHPQAGRPCGGSLHLGVHGRAEGRLSYGHQPSAFRGLDGEGVPSHRGGPPFQSRTASF